LLGWACVRVRPIAVLLADRDLLLFFWFPAHQLP